MVFNLSLAIILVAADHWQMAFGGV